MVEEPITWQEKRSSKITRIKQSLIERIRQTEQNDNVKKKVTWKSIKISNVKKNPIITAHDWIKTAIRDIESWAIGGDIETKVWDSAKRLRVREKLNKIKEYFITKSTTTIEIITTKIIASWNVTKIEAIRVSKRDDEKPIITNVKIEIKVAINI